MLCKELMSKKAYTCKETDTIAECAKIMRDKNIGFVPIVDNKNKVVGVVTDRDLALRAVAEKKFHDTRISDVMTKEVISCKLEDHLDEAESKMSEYRKSRIVVMDEKSHCSGVISLADIGHLKFHGHAGRVFQAVTEREIGDGKASSPILVTG